MGNKGSSNSKKGGAGRKPLPAPTLQGPQGGSHKEETDAAVFYRKGMGYLATQRYQDAVTSFNEALKLRYGLRHWGNLAFLFLFFFFFLFSPSASPLTQSS